MLQDAHLSSLRQLEEERSAQEETLSWAGRLEEEHHARSRDWDLFWARCTQVARNECVCAFNVHLDSDTVQFHLEQSHSLR